VFDVMMSSLVASLGSDAPQIRRPFWKMGLRFSMGDLDVYLRRFDTESVLDNISEARLRRICEAIDTDVTTTGANLVFNLISTYKMDVGYQYLTRVLSLGVRPDVPNLEGKLPLEKAILQGKFELAEALALCGAASVVGSDADFTQVR
jgi:hypothetical protein